VYDIRLSATERYGVVQLSKTGLPQKDIAERLGRESEFRVALPTARRFGGRFS